MTTQHPMFTALWQGFSSVLGKPSCSCCSNEVCRDPKMGTSGRCITCDHEYECHAVQFDDKANHKLRNNFGFGQYMEEGR